MMTIEVNVFITWLQSRVTLIGANTFVVGSAVAFPADVFVWLQSGVTLIGATTFVVGSVAEWLGIRLVIWRSGFNSQLSHIFTHFLSCFYFCSQLTANVFGNWSALVAIVIND